MFGIGPVELAVVFVVALLVFGPTKLPELARTLGKGMREFRRASSELRRSIDLDLDLDEQTKKPPQGPAQTGSTHVPPAPGSPLDQLENAAAGSANDEDSEGKDGALTAGESEDSKQEGSGG